MERKTPKSEDQGEIVFEARENKELTKTAPSETQWGAEWVNGQQGEHKYKTIDPTCFNHMVVDSNVTVRYWNPKRPEVSV